MSGIAWMNGNFIDLAKPSLGLLDRGVLYGDGLFETVRLCNHEPQYWKEHLARLRRGCSVLKINFPEDAISRGMEQVSGKLRNGVLRLTVTRGEHPGRGFLPAGNPIPTVAVTGYPGEPYPEELYRRGFSGTLISFPRNHRSPLVKLKSLNCLENIIGKMEAASAGADEGIFINCLGEVAESTASNIFLVIDDKLLTPPPESGLLPGIMRARVLLLAKKLGIKALQSKVYPDDLCRAGESFLTNSLLGIMPLVSINGHPIGNGKPGKVTALLRREL